MKFKVGDKITFNGFLSGEECNIYGIISNVNTNTYSAQWFNKRTNAHYAWGVLNKSSAIPYVTSPAINMFMED